MQDISEIEQLLIERAADIARPIVDETAKLPDDEALAATSELLRDDADQLSVVSHAYGCVLTILQRSRDEDSVIAWTPSARCGWCAMAAGGTIDAWLRQEVRTLEGAGHHATSCVNNPLVRAAAALVLAFDSDAACDSANSSTREAFAVLRKMIAS